MGSPAWPPTDPGPPIQRWAQLPEGLSASPGEHEVETKSPKREEGALLFPSDPTQCPGAGIWGWYLQKTGRGMSVIVVSSEETPCPGPD